MATTAEAIHVDDYIAMELRTEVHRQLNNLCDSFRIFAVHMEDWNLQHPSNVCRIGTRSRFRWRRREANLIVHNNMNSAACLISGQFTQIQCFLNDAFTSECGVSMHQNNTALATIKIFVSILFRAKSPLSDRVNELQMARIEAQCQMDILPRRSHAIRAITKVILHITTAHF